LRRLAVDLLHRLHHEADGARRDLEDHTVELPTPELVVDSGEPPLSDPQAVVRAHVDGLVAVLAQDRHARGRNVAPAHVPEAGLEPGVLRAEPAHRRTPPDLTGGLSVRVRAEESSPGRCQAGFLSRTDR